MRSKPNHVRSDALKLAEQNTNYLSSFRYLDLQQFLCCHHIREIVSERIQIIHSVGNYDALLIFLVFEKLLHSRVEIANVWNRLYYELAVKAQIKTKNAVR